MGDLGRGSGVWGAGGPTGGVLADLSGVGGLTIDFSEFLVRFPFLGVAFVARRAVIIKGWKGLKKMNDQQENLENDGVDEATLPPTLDGIVRVIRDSFNEIMRSNPEVDHTKVQGAMDILLSDLLGGRFVMSTEQVGACEIRDDCFNPSARITMGVIVTEGGVTKAINSTEFAKCSEVGEVTTLGSPAQRSADVAAMLLGVTGGLVQIMAAAVQRNTPIMPLHVLLNQVSARSVAYQRGWLQSIGVPMSEDGGMVPGAMPVKDNGPAVLDATGNPVKTIEPVVIDNSDPMNRRINGS